MAAGSVAAPAAAEAAATVAMAAELILGKHRVDLMSSMVFVMKAKSMIELVHKQNKGRSQSVPTIGFALLLLRFRRFRGR